MECRCEFCRLRAAERCPNPSTNFQSFLGSCCDVPEVCPEEHLLTPPKASIPQRPVCRASTAQIYRPAQDWRSSKLDRRSCIRVSKRETVTWRDPINGLIVENNLVCTLAILFLFFKASIGSWWIDRCAGFSLQIAPQSLSPSMSSVVAPCQGQTLVLMARKASARASRRVWAVRCDWKKKRNGFTGLFARETSKSLSMGSQMQNKQKNEFASRFLSLGRAISRCCTFHFTARNLQPFVGRGCLKAIGR